MVIGNGEVKDQFYFLELIAKVWKRRLLAEAKPSLVEFNIYRYGKQ